MCETVMGRHYLQHHRDIQHLGVRFVCRHCATKFTIQSSLKIHLAAVHDDTNEVDDSCRQTFLELATHYADYSPIEKAGDVVDTVKSENQCTTHQAKKIHSANSGKANLIAVQSLHINK